MCGTEKASLICNQFCFSRILVGKTTSDTRSRKQFLDLAKRNPILPAGTAI